MAASGFLRTCTCSESRATVLEQRHHFLPLHPWGGDGEEGPGCGDKLQLPPKPTRPSAGAGGNRIGPIPTAWFLPQEWGVISPTPSSASATPGSRLAQRKRR